MSENGPDIVALAEDVRLRRRQLDALHEEAAMLKRRQSDDADRIQQILGNEHHAGLVGEAEDKLEEAREALETAGSGPREYAFARSTEKPNVMYSTEDAESKIDTLAQYFAAKHAADANSDTSIQHEPKAEEPDSTEPDARVSEPNSGTGQGL